MSSAKSIARQGREQEQLALTEPSTNELRGLDDDDSRSPISMADYRREQRLQRLVTWGAMGLVFLILAAGLLM